MRIVRAIRRLPERARFILAGSIMVAAAILIFIAWGALTAQNFASISAAFTPENLTNTSADQPPELPENIFGQLKESVRDLYSLLKSGIVSTEEPAPPASQ